MLGCVPSFQMQLLLMPCGYDEHFLDLLDVLWTAPLPAACCCAALDLRLKLALLGCTPGGVLPKVWPLGRQNRSATDHALAVHAVLRWSS